MSEAQLTTEAVITSSVPGRMRLRVAPGPHRAAAVERARRACAAQPGVRSVAIRESTGSVLVHYDVRVHTAEGLGRALVEHAVADAVEKTAAGAGDSIVAQEASSLSNGLLSLVSLLDRLIFRLTGKTVDLRVLLPIGLGGAGLWLAWTTGSLGLPALPPIVLLWAAVDSFIQLHRGVDTDASALPA